MMNQLIFIGRIKEIKDKNGETIISVENSRPYKNENGEYDTDIVDFKLWGAIADNVKEYCKTNDVVGIKGRIQTKILEDQKITELVAERITFLSTNKEEEK